MHRVLHLRVDVFKWRKAYSNVLRGDVIEVVDTLEDTQQEGASRKAVPVFELAYGT